LFGRAALRDFIDVATVSAAFDRSDLIDLARRIDAGFDEYGANPAELRAFFDAS